MDRNPSQFSAQVSRWIDQTREASGLSVRQLADTTGIPRVTLMRRLSGRSAFTVTELDSVAEALGTTVAAIAASAEDAA